MKTKRATSLKTTTTVAERVCLTPECGASSHRNFGGARGLCTACYQHARQGVKAGHTTWERLEKAGKTRALSPTRHAHTLRVKHFGF